MNKRKGKALVTLIFDPCVIIFFIFFIIVNVWISLRAPLMNSKEDDDVSMREQLEDSPSMMN